MALRFLSILTILVALLAGSAVAQAKPVTVDVMSRNVYLGADLTPGYTATDFPSLVKAAGTIYNDVIANNFPVRARGLAAEVRAKDPDLVGLQEVALWRTQPCDKVPLPPSATTVKYDFLKLLLAQLNKGKKRYSAAVVKKEFDFEVWANTDGNESTAGPNCPFGSELNGRLTMRDVILVKRGVRTSNRKSGTFDTLLRVKPGGFAVDVTRGWTALDATVRGKKLHFVNVHFEAFDSSQSNTTNKDTTVGNGEIRQAQAKELVARRGPARSRLPVVLLGDFNSDVRTEIKQGDSLAYRALLGAGFVERATKRGFTCCLDTSLLPASGEGNRSQFDHTVDHITTSSPKRVKLLRSSISGLAPVNAFWNSDHAGLFSSLRIN